MPPRTEEFREGDKQVDRQEQQIAHESNVITPAKPRKTARQGPFGLEFMNSPPTRYCGVGRELKRLVVANVIMVRICVTTTVQDPKGMKLNADRAGSRIRADP